MKDGQIVGADPTQKNSGDAADAERDRENQPKNP